MCSKLDKKLILHYLYNKTILLTSKGACKINDDPYTTHAMKPTLYILSFSMLMTSCATIMNQSHKKIQIYTSQSSKIIYKQDTISQLGTKTTILVERKNKAVSFLAIGDSLRKTVRVEPRNSFGYFGNILCNAGIGMLVDQKNPKRYTYPSKVYVDFSDSKKRFLKT